MSRRYSFGRRQFLTATGAAGVAGLAGCSALESADDDPAATGDEGPEAAVEQFYESVTAEQQTQSEMFHSEVRGEFELRELETEVVEKDLDSEEFTNRVSLDDDIVERIVDGEQTAIVEAEFEVFDDGNEHEDTVTWALATEDSDWKLVDDGAEDEKAVAPNANFQFDYDDPSQVVTITHTSGSAIEAQYLFVRGEGIAAGYEGAFHEIPESDFQAGEEIAAGDRLDVEVEGSDFDISVVYETEETSDTLATFEGPDA